MGLSSKQVSSDGLDWSQSLLQAQTLELPPKPPLPMKRQQQQQNQQQLEPLKCPRCESTNTKFCYYNNYNKSQPRHFCKTCKRHWTKGGTLRNVPVGGGRKNKRLKTSNLTTTTTTNTTTTSTTNIAIQRRQQQQQQRQNLSYALGDHYQAMIHPPSLLLQQNSINNSNNNGVFIGSSLSLPQNESLHFPFSCSRSFDTNPSFQSSYASNVYKYTGETIEDPIMPTTTSNTTTQAWQMPSTSSGMDMTSYWNWEDIDTLVSTDLNIPWDDPDIKP